VGDGLQRVLDADGNRAAEGLRVLEEIARFVLDDAALAGQLKQIRHRLRSALPPSAIAARDSAGDVGAPSAERRAEEHAALAGLLRANAARAQEALRCLEEYGRLGAGIDAALGERLRYELYRAERALLGRLPAWRLRGVRLYVLVDCALCADPVAVAAAAARGGAGAVQLRGKSLGVRDYRALAERMQEAVRSAGALFVVNDHVAIARLLAADAVHLGQDDLTIADARAVCGPLCAIGCSTHSAAQVDAAQAEGADYLGIGPIHATASKAHEPERGAALLDAVGDRVRVPSFAIGGLDLARVRALGARIPHGIAVAGAVCRAADPERAAAELRDALDARHAAQH